ncbi:transglycosylase domain-containing protein [Bacillus sp. V59.32b]|uniref:transglycosylase domain-containing protein n=1 Tax=Bacillus sp. V59.32b TaxID=1758642 RepID=UPI000E3BEAD7|nr:PBP1A family penicillin-binding protein [Bacillus sp. V59.32b]RFU60086.1 PBP1A family penicillin-binding protein [Bacillus sp. V59.32b]
MAEKYKTREERRKQNEAQKKGKQKKKPKGLFKRIFLFLITLGIIGMLAGGATFAYFISDAPELDEKLLKDPVPSIIKDEEGNEITEVGPEKREYVAYEDVPKLVENAFLATEDVRFYEHHGVDVRRLGGAVLANVTDGFGSQGASTLTQQVVKRSYLTPDKTLKRKAQEMWLSIQLEQKYTKQEIFEMYINKIFFSERANGIATAADVYYGKELKELELHEAALLVGLPQSPNRYNPYDYPERGEKRRNVVLHLMNKHGFITKDEMEKAQAIPVEQGLAKRGKNNADTSPYDVFVDQVIKEVEEMGDYNISADGLEIYTTIDKDAQEYVHKMMTTNEVIQFPSEKLQTGITLLDTKTGEIRAIGGSRKDEFNAGFNFATDTKRSPGSTIKPILDYGPAVEHLKWSTYEQILDEPYKYSTGQKINNASRRHYGKVSAREALGRSLNIPALKTAQEVGLERAQEFGEDLGIPFKKPMTESGAIGAGLGVSSLQMAGAYSAFGNGGIYNEPHTVKKIVLRDKTTTIKNKAESRAVMKDSTAFIVTDMLKSVLTAGYGTGRAANIPGLPVAGKTGTTNYTEEEKRDYNVEPGGAPDSWFVGYTTNYTAAVWTGYDNKRNFLGKSSQAIPKEAFRKLMSHVSQGKETKDFKKPSSVVKVGIVKGSDPAMLPSEYTPKDRIVYEYFVKGTEPTQVTKEFDKLEGPQNVKASFDEESKEIKLEWDYPESDEDVEFEVKVAVDGAGERVLSVDDGMELTIANPAPGAYTFSVTAISDDQRSEPASAAVQVPDPNEEEEEQPETDPEELPPGELPPGELPPGEGNGNGQGNGNGNGQGNGNGNGNNRDDEEEEEPEEGGNPGNGGNGRGPDVPVESNQ